MRIAQELVFDSQDGTSLFYRYWPRASGAATRAIVLLHRGHEHSGRVQHIVDELQFDDFAFFAWDARGHGRSPGARGDSPGVATSVKDLDAFVRHIVDHHGIAIENVALIAQSVGAVLATTWVHDYAPRVRCLVVAAPAFKVKLYVPFARPLLKFLTGLRGNFFVNSYVKAKFLTHDPERIASYAADPLITRAISVRMLLGLYDAAERVIADAGAIRVPVQVLISGADWVVHQEPQHRFFERLGSPDKDLHTFAGFYHDTLGEKNRHLAMTTARGFITRHFARPFTRPSLIAADREGYTSEETKHLLDPVPALSWKAIYFGAIGFGMRTLGRLSAGVRVGLSTGFDSGSTLDYVYRNQPEGTTTLGQAIDRGFLGAIGWQGIRVRKAHIEEAIRAAFARLKSTGTPVRILDVAAGHGRYVLDAVQTLPTRPEAVLLRDFSPINVAQGAALIGERNLTNIAQFALGDAFDAQSLAALAPQPTVAIVSGLYELFPENAPVIRSLEGISAAVPPGGYLIYTGQPWHPQLELIARTLTSHREGRPWIMRRRTQAELDQLVERVGFRKLEQWIDEWGIFTVSLAVRT